MSTVTEPRARFSDLVAAEWIKLWSLRSTPFGLAVSALIILGITVNTAVADYTNWPHYSAGIREIFVPIWAMRDAFSDPAGLVLVLAASSIGAVTVVGEYSSGMIRTTFGAVPARRSVMAAKVTVVTAVFLAFGAIVSAAAFGVSQAILSGRDIGLSIGYPDAPRAVLASALLAPLCALVGMGVGAIVRHTATTIVLTTGILVLLPRLMEGRRHHWVAVIRNAMPASAWERLTATGVESALEITPFQASITASWVVFAAWSLLAAALTVVFVHHREL